MKEESSQTERRECPLPA